MNNRGPNINPWGISQIISYEVESWLFENDVNWVLPLKIALEPLEGTASKP